ncbi:hypothetical protein TNCV_3055861 [Trichonephila clavipes]|nr:hypothetical protein TNCV_3055861 [Trichonephila clavipes]
MGLGVTGHKLRSYAKAYISNIHDQSTHFIDLEEIIPHSCSQIILLMRLKKAATVRMASCSIHRHLLKR